MPVPPMPTTPQNESGRQRLGLTRSGARRARALAKRIDVQPSEDAQAAQFLSRISRLKKWREINHCASYVMIDSIYA
jgi:hypothetical protein